VKSCPEGALELVTELIDLEDKTVVALSESHRKKVSYTCSLCKADENKAPCVLACSYGAIKCVWKPL
jgi:Fe-S-cluster-containing hydrogenase component 2